MTLSQSVFPNQYRWPVAVVELPALMCLLLEEILPLRIATLPDPDVFRFQLVRHISRSTGDEVHLRIHFAEHSLLLNLLQIVQANVLYLRQGMVPEYALELYGSGHPQYLQIRGPQASEDPMGREIWSTLVRALSHRTLSPSPEALPQNGAPPPTHRPRLVAGPSASR